MTHQDSSATLARRLDELSKRTGLLVVASSAVLLPALDHVVPELGAGPLYIPLIAFAGWRFGLRGSLGIMAWACLMNIAFNHVYEPAPTSVAVARTIMRIGIYGFIVLMVESLRGAYDREAVRSRIDGLTGALNRAAFDERFEVIVRRLDRSAVTWMLAIVDIDNFKAINDRHGHAAGDQVLQKTVAAMIALGGPSGYVGRLGGDEFAMLSPAPSLKSEHALAGQIREELTRTLSGAATVSVGTVMVSGKGTTSGQLMHAADMAMYRGKTRQPIAA